MRSLNSNLEVFLAAAAFRNNHAFDFTKIYIVTFVRKHQEGDSCEVCGNTAWSSDIISYGLYFFILVNHIPAHDCVAAEDVRRSGVIANSCAFIRDNPLRRDNGVWIEGEIFGAYLQSAS